MVDSTIFRDPLQLFLVVAAIISFFVDLAMLIGIIRRGERNIIELLKGLWTNRLFPGSSLVLVLSLLILLGMSVFPQPLDSREVTLKPVDFYENNVSVDPKLGKAVIYGSITSKKDLNVPKGKTQLIVEITIPSNGFGEGLAGPSGSAVQIEIDGQVKSERITDDVSQHHGWYYKYEYGARFSNTFDVTGKDNVVLTIRMVDRAHLDFKQAKLTFQ